MRAVIEKADAGREHINALAVLLKEGRRALESMDLPFVVRVQEVDVLSLCEFQPAVARTAHAAVFRADIADILGEALLISQTDLLGAVGRAVVYKD